MDLTRVKKPPAASSTVSTNVAGAGPATGSPRQKASLALPESRGASKADIAVALILQGGGVREGGEEGGEEKAAAGQDSRRHR